MSKLVSSSVRAYRIAPFLGAALAALTYRWLREAGMTN